jgi:hypothetical protein
MVLMKEYASRQDMLADLVPADATVAEIGVFAGDFSEWMLKHLKLKKFYAVDPYTSTIGVMGSGNQDGFDMEYYELKLLQGFVQTRLGHYPAFEQRREFSHSFFESQDDGSLDAIYLDGDHSFDNVRGDLENARRVVKEGGWIFGHDYDTHPEKGNPAITHAVKPVVDEFCEKNGLTLYALSNDGVRSFAIQNTKKYKFCIVSVSDRPDLYTKTFPLMQSYCKKHSYNLHLHTSVLDKDRHPSWSKIPALSLALQENAFDYIVWMDDDIVITNPDIPLSHFVDKYNFRKIKATVLVSADMPNEPSTVMNCGILFLKAKSPIANALLQSVWQFADMCPMTRIGFSWEQEAFNFLYRYGDREDFSIIPLPNFQAPARFQFNQTVTWKPGYFSAHLNNGALPIKLQTFELLKKVCKFT